MAKGRIFLITLILAGCGSMQGRETGVVTGQILSGDTGYHLIGATISVAGVEPKTVSGPGGAYTLRNVPAGRQTVVVKYIGLGSREETVTVSPSATVHLDIVLGGEMITCDAPRSRNAFWAMTSTSPPTAGTQL